MNAALAAREAYADAFARRERSAISPPWLAALRRDARARFEALGFPHVRLEEWRFTNPAPLTQAVFADAALATGPVPPLPALGAWDRVELALVNGRYAPDLARLPGLPGGAWVGGLAAAIANPIVADRIARTLGAIAPWQERAFVALNTALIDDGILVHVAPDVKLTAPVHVGHAIQRHDAGPVAAHPRVLVIADRGARLTVIEDFRGSQRAGDFVNSVIEFDLGEGAGRARLAARARPGVAPRRGRVRAAGRGREVRVALDRAGRKAPAARRARHVRRPGR